MISFLSRSLVLILSVWLGCSAASAQSGVPLPEFGGQQRQERLQQIEVELANATALPVEALRVELTGLRVSSLEARHALVDGQAQVNRLIDALGPVPTDRSESEEVVAERQRLAEQYETVDGYLRINALNLAASERLLAQVAGRRRVNFIQQVFDRTPVPLNADTFAALGQAGQDVAHNISGTWQGWGGARNFGGVPAAIWTILAVFGGLVLMVVSGRTGDRLITGRLESLEPNEARRTAVALIRVGVRVLPGAIVGALILWTMTNEGYLPGPMGELAWLLFNAIALYLVVDGFATAFMAPKRREWSLFHVPPGKAAKLRVVIDTITVLFALDRVTMWSLTQVAAPIEAVQLVETFLTALVAAASWVLTRPSWWPVHERGAGWLRLGLRLVAILSALMLVTGYTALAQTLIGRGMVLAALAILFWIARRVYSESLGAVDAWLSSGRKRAGRSEDPSTGMLRFWAGLVTDLIMLGVFGIPVLLIFGVELDEIRAVLERLLYGFEIGGVSISLGRIGGAIILFIAVLFVTSLTQRVLDQRMKSVSHEDDSFRSSVRVLLGYLGLMMAVVMALGALGIGLQNLALIAGALSVGIGFGLQTIVNNFVSGLILLFERPIRLGDWIVTASGEGWVRRIGIRSTEIETFDRAAIVVPNSELVGSTVTNWTRRDRTGRIILPVGVSYNSDPEKVREILQRCAAEHPEVLTEPPIFIYWADFADSSLNFEVRAFIKDVSRHYRVRNDLRFTIFEAFKEAGIEIPFPQRDIHIRSGGAGGQLPDV
ncbi:mechanosensitive ion channel domain-containing protein [uncultured Maricaulis sp.]|uniref:mechanosensitive ion channel domain-containing protein n=1 Tax=uncultured Maricaulis sp. TaxID=174710 RepID=UPI0030D95699|tara:strand:- start:28584 stop:30908 length:2325 start_codon:yes stop_codon:yes gene_type:complete